MAKVKITVSKRGRVLFDEVVDAKDVARKVKVYGRDVGIGRPKITTRVLNAKDRG
jgi:hypothetical protein